MDSEMNNTDKILYYGVWGSLIGAAIFYSFPYMRFFTAPIIQYLFASFIDPFSPNLGVLTFFINIFWGVIAASIPAIISTLIIKFILKARTILYCAIPILLIFVLSYWNIVEMFKYYSSYEELPAYIPELLNPLLLIGVFVGTYALFDKLIALNKAPQSTPQSGAPEL